MPLRPQNSAYRFRYEPISVNGGRIAARRGSIVKERLDIARIKAVGPMAELAGDGDRALLPEHVAYLVRSQAPEADWSPGHGCSGTRTAPARRGRAACHGRQSRGRAAPPPASAADPRGSSRSMPRSACSQISRICCLVGWPHPPAASAPGRRRPVRRRRRAARASAAAPSGQNRPRANLPANRRSGARFPGSACCVSSASTVTATRPSVPTRRRKTPPLARLRGSSVRGECRDRSGVEARHRAQPIIVRALRDKQAHRAIALQLQRQLTAEFQGGGQQHRGGDGLAEKLAHGLRIIAMGAQLAPGAFQAHPVAADRPVLDDEATNLVAGSWLADSCPENGARTPITQPGTF